MIRSIRETGWLLIVAAAATGAALSQEQQLPTARLDNLFPLGAQVGTSVEVAAGGAYLSGPRQLLFNHPGIKGEPTGNGASFKVTVAPDMKPGVYEAAFAGEFGVSSPRWFSVGERPEAVVPGEASRQDSAPALVLGTIYNGRADAGKAHFFKLALAADDRVFVDCFAERIGTRMDALLVLFDASGAEVARSREARDGDPLLDFKASAAGDYTVRVSDFLAAGGANHGYRLVARKGPQIDFVQPPSALPGTRQKFTLLGRNLPGGSASDDGLERIEVEIDVPPADQAESRSTAPIKPAAAPLAKGFHYSMDGSNRVFIAHASAPVAADPGTEAGSADARLVSFPGEIGGRFYPGATEWFRFDVKKGQAVLIELVSQRLGEPSDPVLAAEKLIVGEDGKEVAHALPGGDDVADNIGGRRYPTNHRDPAVQFTADFDGAVRVSVRDQFGTRSPFRLIVRDPRPDFEVLASLPQPPGDNNGGKKVARSGLALRRGEVAEIDVYALRREGFAGAIEIIAEGLPAGFAARPLTIPKGQHHEPLVIAAGAEASDWAGELRLTAKATIGKREVVKRAVTVAVNWTVGNADVERVASRVGSGLAVASVAEAAPLTIAAAEDKEWETCLGANLQVPVKLVKSEGLNVKDKVLVRAESLPGTGKKKAQIDLGKDKVDGTLTIPLQNNKDGNKYAAGTHALKLLATAKIDYRRGVAEANAAAERQKSATAEADGKKKARDEAKTAVDAAKAATAETEAAKTQGVAAAEASLKAAEEAAASAEAARVAAEAAAKGAAEKAKPKEVIYRNYSLPITVKIASSPVKLTAGEGASVAKGAKVEIPVALQRLYGFADEVKLSAKLPDGTKGVSVPEVAVAKEAGDGKLVIETSGEAPAGELAVELVAKMKFNGIDLVERVPLKLTISES